MFDTLRREDPGALEPEERDRARGFWAVTRYDDICAVDKDAETFTSTKFVNLEEVDDDLMDLRRSILETDGPRHRALRKLIQREFSPGNLMRNYEDFLRGLTKQTVDEALRDDEFDFVEKISADFPIQVLARLLDVPSSDTGQLIAWGNQMVGNTDPDYTEHLSTDPESEQVQAPAVPLARLARGLRVRPRAGRGSARAATAPTWSACSSTSMPEDGEPLTATRLRQLLPAAGHRRQRDHPAHDQPLDARR